MSASDGLTEQFLYDDNLSDGVGLDSSGGVARLIGSDDVSLSAAITKLAATEANGGAGITFSTDAPGSARVSINGAGEVSFSIADAAGRSVISGQLDDTNALLTWSCSLHDATASLSGYGTVLETRSINALGKDRRQWTDAAGRTLRSFDELDEATVFTYDASGNQLTVQDPNGVGEKRLFTMRWDVPGFAPIPTATQPTAAMTLRATASRPPTARATPPPTAYDARGRQRSSKPTGNSGETELRLHWPPASSLRLPTRKSQTTSYTYDDAGNKLTETYPDHVTSSTGGPNRLWDHQLHLRSGRSRRSPHRPAGRHLHL